MKTRYSFGGDEHIFVEVDEEMSLEAFFKSLAMTKAVRESQIKGVTEICPANASLQVKFDPDQISPDDMLAELKSLEASAEQAEAVLQTRIIVPDVRISIPEPNILPTSHSSLSAGTRRSNPVLYHFICRIADCDQGWLRQVDAGRH